jgi:sugar lactone lactonase YvrE
MMRSTAVVVFAVVALCLGVSSSALASSGHALLGNFGVAGSNDLGGFAGGGPAGVAVRQSTGDVFVSDPGHVDPVDQVTAVPRVEVFDAAGAFLSDFAIDVAAYSSPGAVAIDGSGASDVVYVGAVENATATGAVLRFSPAGVAGVPLDATGSGSMFANPVAVAVDPSDGTVYVSAIDSTTVLPVIDVYSGLGVFERKFDGSNGAPGGAALGGIAGLAVDGSGRLYVSDGAKVYRYSAAGVYQATIDDGSGGSPGAVTADAGSDRVYVVESNAGVNGFSPGGVARVEAFGTNFVTGVAINQSTETVYTADPVDLVGQISSVVVAPTVTTGVASPTGTGARLNGTVNPEGVAGSTYHFDYGLTASYGKSTTATDPGSGSATVAASAVVSQLLPSTTYHFRLVASGNGATIYGADQSLTTHSGPDAVTGAVTGVSTTAAAFGGSYDTHGVGGSYQFVVGSSTIPYLAETDPVTVSDAGTASGGLGNLPAGQTYQARIAVTSDGVTTMGDTVTFATPPQPAALPTPPAAAQAVGPYGCSAPVLNAYNQHPKAGETITITGTDLGVGGNATLGTSPVTASIWSANGLTITLPDDATGSLALTVNCGAVSNTIAIQIYQAPSNTFTTTAKAAKTGSTVTVSVKVPGPGSITITGANVKTATKHVAKAGSTTVKTVLSGKASRSLKRHHKLTVTINVRFTPTGGTSRTVTKSATFTRKPGH